MLCAVVSFLSGKSYFCINNTLILITFFLPGGFPGKIKMFLLLLLLPMTSTVAGVVIVRPSGPLSFSSVNKVIDYCNNRLLVGTHLDKSFKSWVPVLFLRASR